MTTTVIKSGRKSTRGAIDPDRTRGALARFRGMIPSLLPAERKVANYIIDNSEAVLAQSVGEVAAGSTVSEATVIRFCRTARFKGFADMKISLARELVSPLASTLHEDVSEKDDPARLARKVFGMNIETLRDTLSVIDPASIARATSLIESGGKTLVIGVGTSAPIAFDGYSKFMRIGLNVSLQTDAHLMMMEAALMKKGDVILAISHSGATIDPVETVKVGRKAGARIISITNNMLSPIAKVSDVTLVTASKETKFRTEALASRIAQASILDLLYVSIGLKNKRRAFASSKKIEDVITAKQY
ncbi:Sialic acid utilization regulator, RpiR family [hydrothermal vent metagenome]|uniref:Sialic acid utilization regulator, RpiR family n=1 Tax=hydrothermal vent metagenome TaxID=652676 RepID=A0A3B1CR52_9ZZZZ